MTAAQHRPAGMPHQIGNHIPVCRRSMLRLGTVSRCSRARSRTRPLQRLQLQQRQLLFGESSQRTFATGGIKPSERDHLGAILPLGDQAVDLRRSEEVH